MCICVQIYIYRAWLRKSGTLFGFLIWTLLYWGSGPYIFYQSIYRPTYLSMHLTTNIFIYMCVCVCVCTHICMCGTYTYIHSCRLASRLVCIFCHKYRSLSMFATHLLLSKLLFEGRICFSRYWNLGTNDDFQYRALGSLPIMSWKDLVHHMYLGLGQNISF